MHVGRSQLVVDVVVVPDEARPAVDVLAVAGRHAHAALHLRPSNRIDPCCPSRSSPRSTSRSTPTRSPTARPTTRSCASCARRRPSSAMGRMQIAPDQGAFLTLLVAAHRRAPRSRGRHLHRLLGALRSRAALPEDGRLLCCDVSEEWTAIARAHWEQAGVDATTSTCASGPPPTRCAACRSRRSSTSPSSTPTRRATPPTTTRS